MLPAVGSASIWRPPVALYFLVTGAVWEGLVLIALGALVIALADNLLRPHLIGMDTKLPDYIVLISTLGAIAVFGLRCRDWAGDRRHIHCHVGHLFGSNRTGEKRG
jgi:predicted PurR-regulated permease PerM